jgi:hypothetical protein
MRISALIGIGVLSLLLGFPAATYALDEPKAQQEDPKPEPTAKDEAKPEAKPSKDEAKAAKAEAKASKNEAKNEAKAAKQQEDEAKPPKQQEEEAKPAKQPKEAKPPKNDEPNRPSQANQQGSNNTPAAAQPGKSRQPSRSARIPDDKFRAHFGRSHTVVINQPVIVEGQPRFQFGGYWFVISDPWPAEWAYTDDCYIDYVDGEYFLFDLLHPGVRVALFVVM